jgi:pSer/pThr/pTyr-binding forkhead associated (FHA) protein
MLGVTVLILRLLLVIALYAFILLALFSIWRNMVLESHLVNGKQLPIITLESSGLQTEKYQFKQREVWIGRSPTCDLSLREKSVSINHARLSYKNRQWWLSDTDSMNGTFLNGERISEPVVVTKGDSIRIGNMELIISMEKS